MFGIGGSVRIYYCPTPINLRKSFDGLAGAVEEYIKQDPESGHVFAFFSRANFKSIGSLVLITCFFVRQNRFGALIQTFSQKNGKKSNFGPFSSSPVNAGCSRYPVVYVSLISSIQAC